MITQNDRAPASTEELLVTGRAQIDALVKLFIAKGIITQQEFLQKTAEAARRIKFCERDTAGYAAAVMTALST